MAKIRGSFAVASAAACIVSVSAPLGVLAHEQRTVSGKYDVLVGWQVEPVLQGQKNAVSVRITRADSGQPVGGLSGNLALELRYATSTREYARELPLRNAPDTAGEYLADVIPTRAGEYQVRLRGMIDRDRIDEQFRTVDGKLEGVDLTTDVEFPLPIMATEDVAQTVSQLGVETTDLQRDVQVTRALGVSGIALGAIAIIVTLVTRTRRLSAPPTRPPREAESRN